MEKNIKKECIYIYMYVYIIYICKTELLCCTTVINTLKYIYIFPSLPQPILLSRPPTTLPVIQATLIHPTPPPLLSSSKHVPASGDVRALADAVPSAWNVLSLVIHVTCSLSLFSAPCHTIREAFPYPPV